jgi:hypothetical protein
MANVSAPGVFADTATPALGIWPQIKACKIESEATDNQTKLVPERARYGVRPVNVCW